jgi:hypothetical protein
MTGRSYKADDLKKITLEDFLSRRSELVFGSRGPNAESISCSIAEGALILGARKILVTEQRGWWYVCADQDWLQVPTINGIDEETVFKTICGFPQAGVNWHRSEALCRVYSDAAFSVSGTRIYRVKGEEPSDDEILASIERLGIWARVIGFMFRDTLLTSP